MSHLLELKKQPTLSHMLISRSQVTATKPMISTEIAEFQKAFFDEDLLDEYREDGGIEGSMISL